MVQTDEGLTKTYNRFHDPDERSPKISFKLRKLYTRAMDRASSSRLWLVTASQPSAEFLLDYEIDEERVGQE